MELTKLSLAPKHLVAEKSSNPRKRKFPSIFDLQCHDQLLDAISGPASTQASVDLQVKDSLPLDREQCLDFKSGKMYHLNRKTSRKTWNWPKDQKLDLELNISSKNISPDQTLLKEEPNNIINCKKINRSSSTNMVALACLNCHLLVILSKSFPSCPNCKFVHSLASSNCLSLSS